MADEILRQPSGIAMVMALLRYITRSAVKLNRAEMTEKLLAYLPKEGGFLMETLAQEWIEEGKTIGFDLGKQEGIDIGKQEGIDIGKQEGIDIGKQQGIAQGVAQGVAAQQQTLLQLLQWRFVLTPAAHEAYAQQIARIQNLDHLVQLVNQLLTTQNSQTFDQALVAYLPPAEGKP